MSVATIAPVTGRRRRTDQIMRALLLLGTLVAIVPLVLVVYYLVQKGIGAISWSFFTTDPTGSFLGDPGAERERPAHEPVAPPARAADRRERRAARGLGERAHDAAPFRSAAIGGASATV